jgi:hypothetical protein
MSTPAPVRAVLAGASPRTIDRYGALLDRLPGVELVAAVEWNTAHAAAFKRRWETLPVFTSQEELRRAVPHDLVIIALPAACHFSAAKSALRAGKHVLCEPPLALLPSDAHDALHDARERGLVLASGLARAPRPGRTAARSRGRLTRITLRWDVQDGRLPRAGSAGWDRIALRLGSYLLPFLADREPVSASLPSQDVPGFSAVFRDGAAGEVSVSADAVADREDGSCLMRVEWADAPPTELSLQGQDVAAAAGVVDRILRFDPAVEADRREDEIWVAQLARGWAPEPAVELVGGGPPISRYRGTSRPRS